MHALRRSRRIRSEKSVIRPGLQMMGVTTEEIVEARPGDSRVQAVPVACIDLDLFCGNCGYNLRTLPVFRDDHTGIPVVRCPECGRFQSANDASTALRPWLDRLTLFLLGMWILFLVAVMAHLCLAEGAVSYANLDELTEHVGTNVRWIGNTTIRIGVNTSAPLEVNTEYPGYEFFIAWILLGSFMIAFAGGMFAVIAMPHWRRGAYAGLMLAMPVIAGVVVAVVWENDSPPLFSWGIPYIAAHAGAQLLGGLAGIACGRPLGRLAVRVCLPPSARPRLAFLWLADGKPFPRPWTDPRFAPAGRRAPSQTRPGPRPPKPWPP